MTPSRRAVLGVAAAVALGAARGQPMAASKLCALSFDDGPSPELTPTVLDVLKAKGARAAFFCCGAAAVANPGLVKRILAEGHQLGGHGYRHLDFTKLDLPGQTGELLATWRELLRITGGSASGVPITLFRYPWNHPTGYADWWLGRYGMTRVGFDPACVSGDWGCPGSGVVYDKVMAGVRDQSIIVLHDGRNAVNCGRGQIEHYLPRLVDGLRAAGYDLGRISPSTAYSQVNQSYVTVEPFP